MIQWIIAAALVAAAIPFIAIAESCPSRADLETGIVLSSTTSPTRVVNKRNNGSHSITTINYHGEHEADTTMWVSHPLAIPLPSDSANVSFSHDRPVSDLDKLDEIGSWSSTATVRDGDEIMVVINQTAEMSGQASVMLSGCSYVSWQVRQTLSGDDGNNFVLEVEYLPELGIVVSDLALAYDVDKTSSLSFDQIAAE